MGSFSLISLFTLSLLCCSFLIQAQQPYVGKKTTDCSNPDTSDSVLGYTCNGLNRSCQGYLVFRSQPSFNSVTSISNLLSANPTRVAEINEVSETASLETNQLVIVPVNCSCSGDYYQTNTTYTVQSGDGYLSIANNTYQALSTCQAIQNQQPGIPSNSLTIGLRITVPLRCACPTKNQTDVGINYLLTYLVAEGESVSGISQLFGADYERTLEANELSDTIINFFTTLLVPLRDPPSKITVPSPPPPPPPPSSPTAPTPSSGSSNRTWVYVLVGVLGGAALLFAVGTVVFCVFFRKSKKKTDLVVTNKQEESFEAHGKPLVKKKPEDESQDFLDSMSSIGQSLNLKMYKFEELQLATDNFSPSSQIKGSVYRGVITGDFAAIKKVHGDVSKEIELLNKVNHSNLIRLSGVCFHDGHCYLVYEYAANGALSNWIFQSDNSGKYLSWKQRIQIALDVATGLNYLHSFTNPPHVHKDLKSSNVLLDGDFRAKIANFAQARSTEGQFALTRHIVGTKGYMAPEYLENGLVSTKLDVYAFGVLLLEIITGKEAAALYGDEYMNLSNILSKVLQEKDGKEGLKHLIDPFMLENYPSELAIIVMTLINTCLKKDPTARPAMDEIVHSLSRVLTTSSAWDSSRNTSWSQTSSGSYR